MIREGMEREEKDRCTIIGIADLLDQIINPRDSSGMFLFNKKH
jgi:hypothetical protein